MIFPISTLECLTERNGQILAIFAIRYTGDHEEKIILILCSEESSCPAGGMNVEFNILENKLGQLRQLFVSKSFEPTKRTQSSIVRR